MRPLSVVSHITDISDDPSLRGGQGTKGRGFLSVTALPGALVYLDESRTPMLAADGLPIHTPFSRYPLPGGVHSFRIAPDDAFQSTESGPHPAYQLAIANTPPNLFGYNVYASKNGSPLQLVAALEPALPPTEPLVVDNFSPPTDSLRIVVTAVGSAGEGPASAPIGLTHP